MTEITVQNLINSTMVLMRLADEKLPAVLSFRVAKFLTETKPSVTSFEEQRDKIISDLPAEEPERNKVFQEKIAEILKETVPIPDVKSFPVESLGDISLTPQVMSVLFELKFLTEE